jgi:UDP-N-acetyl-D-mannosaminuronate dehydrogenase
MSADALRKAIADRTACVGVIGCGYVGLPLAVGFAKAGYGVVAIDVDAERVRKLQAGQSYIQDVPSAALAEQVKARRFKATTDYGALRDAHVIFVAVPTPFDRAKQPDLSYIISAAESIAAVLQKGQLIVLESTTYPGTTDEVMRPILERSGLRAGTDFYLAFSPERIDPGNKTFGIENTPKVVGGIDPESTALAAAALQQITKGGIHTVSSARVAELTKLLENTFRAVNIALVNELAMLCDRMGIDIWEVIDAAATKPYGFMPFYPGPGVGGHCLGPDEYVYAREGDTAGPRGIADLWRQSADAGRVEAIGDVEAIRAPGFMTLGVGVDGRPQWEPVTWLFKRPFSGELITITTGDGGRIVVTDGHPMLVLEDDRAVERVATEIQVDDALPVLGESIDVASQLGYGRTSVVAVQQAVRVTSIERRTEDTTVYSLETPRTHTFALGGGVFVHNCIPVDPYYLAWKAREYDFHTKFIELAAETNLAMPFFTVGRIRKYLNDAGRPLRGSRVLVLGASFKKDIDDARESPAIRVMEILHSEGAEVEYHDPHVPMVKLASPVFASNGRHATLRSVPLDAERLRKSDCVVILVAHTAVDYSAILREAPRVFDAVNATHGRESHAEIERL